MYHVIDHVSLTSQWQSVVAIITTMIGSPGSEHRVTETSGEGWGNVCVCGVVLLRPFSSLPEAPTTDPPHRGNLPSLKGGCRRPEEVVELLSRIPRPSRNRRGPTPGSVYASVVSGGRRGFFEPKELGFPSTSFRGGVSQDYPNSPEKDGSDDDIE